MYIFARKYSNRLLDVNVHAQNHAHNRRVVRARNK